MMEKLLKDLLSQKNQGRAHVFLGDCRSTACDKTTVEPGNCFSPGVWTCGVYWGVGAYRYQAAHELADGQWGFSQGLPPVLEAQCVFDNGVTACAELGHLGGEGAYGADFLRITLKNPRQDSCNLYLTVKETGPAGGRIESMTAAENALVCNGGLILSWEQPAGTRRILPPEETRQGFVGIVGFAIPPGDSTFAFKAEHGFYERAFGDSLPHLRPFSQVSAAQGLDRTRQQWRQAVPAQLFCPDQGLEQLWQRQIFHILSAMEMGLPRIGAVNYPVFWMRDAVIILRALDLVGRHDLARQGCDYLAPLLYSGGFGAEADAPGEALWTLVNHAKITGDWAWLENNFSAIEKRADCIRDMATTKKPLYGMAENRMPGYQASPAVNLLCLPSQDGRIHGRMDWHCPDFFINCWSIGGLQAAEEAAQHLNRQALAQTWRAWRQDLEAAVRRNLLEQYGNDRDPIITPYPSGALADDPQLRQHFLAWYQRNRLDSEGKRRKEPLWTYFEAAQAHNAMLLGFVEQGWVNLRGMLEDGETPYLVSAFPEGEPGGNEYLNFRNGEARRGWLDPEKAVGGNLPHNWTSAELVNCIRDIFVVEECGGLVLGQGIPASWLYPGSHFGVENFPTAAGPVSYTATVQQDGISVDYQGNAPWRLARHLTVKGEKSCPDM